MQLWTWKNWQGKPFLTCDLLPFSHGFFTQHFYPALPEALTEAIAPAAQVYRVKQVHSADVLTPTAINEAMDEVIAAGLPTSQESSSASLPPADGVVSEQRHQAVWACSADCTPVLIGDVVTGQVAAVHAGWRGTAQKIVPAAVLRLKAQGSQLKNLRIALGPAIDGSVYQVGNDVAAEVGLTVVSASYDQNTCDQTKLPANALSVEAVVAHLMEMENPPLLSDPEENRVRLDVRQINQMQLEQIGIDPDQIAIAPHCTYQDAENFFSYRRTREKKVQWSGIVSQ